MSTSIRYSPETRERAVRLVLDAEGRHESQWAAIREFRSSDFFERRDGQVRLMPVVTDQLVATMPRWSKECRRVAKAVFEDLMGRRIRIRRSRD